MHLDPSSQTIPSAPAAGLFDPRISGPQIDWPDLDAAANIAPVDRVQLGRIVMLAAETGARFERDAIGADPAAWMVAPRRLFGGSSAVEACRDEGEFLKGMLLHGLSVGLDADPELLDRLVEDDRVDAQEGEACRSPDSPAAWPRMDLYTATLVCERSSSTSHIFHACMAFGPADVLCELEHRVGKAAGRQARVRRGFDPSDPVAIENVSQALGAVLLEVAADPNSPLSHGLNIFVEHRFQH